MPQWVVNLLCYLADIFRFSIDKVISRYRRLGNERFGVRSNLIGPGLQAPTDGMHQAQRMALVGQLACGIAHDFNNSLQIAKAALVLGGKRLEQKRILECQEILKHADDSLARAGHLSRRLLALASPRPDEVECIDVNDAIGGMEHLLGCALGSANTLSLVLDANPLRVGCAIRDFENVLLNLAINARDAMAAGGHLTISSYRADFDAEHAALDPGPYIGVDITDTGSGMEPSVVKAAFDAFFTTKPPGRGTGLGLAMVKCFVDGHRGLAEIISAPGQGTTVRIYLPACR